MSSPLESNAWQPSSNHLLLNRFERIRGWPQKIEITFQVCSMVFDPSLCPPCAFKEKDDRWASVSVSNRVGTSIVGRDATVRGVYL